MYNGKQKSLPRSRPPVPSLGTPHFKFESEFLIRATAMPDQCPSQHWLGQLSFSLHVLPSSLLLFKFFSVFLWSPASLPLSPGERLSRWVLGEGRAGASVLGCSPHHCGAASF